MNHQLVIQFPISDGSAADFDRFIMIENELELILRDKHKVDGHDIGSGEMNVFISTDDPKKAFELAKAALTERDFESILVAFRKNDNEEYSVIWPKDFKGEFNIL